LSPESSNLHYWFGKFVLQDEENVDDAIMHFENAHSLDSSSNEVLLALSRAYMFQHEFEKSRNVLNKFDIESDSSDDHHKKIYFDTDVQIHYRSADDYSSNNDLEKSLISLNNMKESFMSIPSKYKDKYLRNKLSKCNHVMYKIRKIMTPEYEGELAVFKDWINTEAPKVDRKNRT